MSLSQADLGRMTAIVAKRTPPYVRYWPEADSSLLRTGGASPILANLPFMLLAAELPSLTAVI